MLDLDIFVDTDCICMLRNCYPDLLPEVTIDSEEDAPKTTGDEENLAEALKAANTALNKTQIPPNVQKILSADQCVHLKDKNSFWIIAAALREFMDKEGNGALPVRGSLPDMTSDSQRYIALQNVYGFVFSSTVDWKHI